MKYLLVLLVVVIGVFALMGRSRRPPATPDAKPAKPGRSEPAPATMLACAHCGLHLPGDEAHRDAEGRAFCSDAHRLAGPRSPGPG